MTTSPADNPQAAVLQAMGEYANAIRGDWSNFDGRSEKEIINGWVAELRNPDPAHDIDWHQHDLGICITGSKHWCGHWGYCDDTCGCEACA